MVQNAANLDPGRKRRLRLIVALTAVVLLASALVYTSFSASSETRTPSDLLASAEEGESYEPGAGNEIGANVGADEITNAAGLGPQGALGRD